MKRELVTVSLLLGTAQLSAFVKLWFTARIFGVSAELDAYNLALVLPTMISGIIIAALQTGLFPVRAKLQAMGDLDAVAAFERSILIGVSFLGGITTFIFILSTPWLPDIIAASASHRVYIALKFTLPIVSVLIVLNIISECVGYFLAMRNRYWIYAGASVANGIFGASLLFLRPEGGLFNLVLSTLLGLILQIAICFLALKALGLSFNGILPTWNRRKQYWREMFMLSSWILPGVVFSNIAASLPQLWMVQYGEGAVSAFSYAYRLHMSASQLLIMAGSTVILAHFADLVAIKNMAKVYQIINQSAFFAFVVGIIGILAVWFLGVWFLKLLFGGRFDFKAAQHVVSHWLWLMMGLPFSILGNVFAKYWQAQRKPKLISIMAGISLLTLITIYMLIQKYMQELSCAIALSASSLSVVLIGYIYNSYQQRQQIQINSRMG